MLSISSTPSSELCSRFNAATEGARRALREAIAKHEAAVRQFEQEQAWIQPFLATKPAPAAPESWPWSPPGASRAAASTGKL